MSASKSARVTQVTLPNIVTLGNLCRLIIILSRSNTRLCTSAMFRLRYVLEGFVWFVDMLMEEDKRQFGDRLDLPNALLDPNTNR
jgi:hypothetical protein